MFLPACLWSLAYIWTSAQFPDVPWLDAALSVLENAAVFSPRSTQQYDRPTGAHSDFILWGLRAKKPKGSRGEGIEAGRYVPLAEINLLMESFSMDETKAGCRDRAMLSIGWRLGPRVSEIAGLSMKSISPVSGSPKLEYEIRIIGKGNKQRPAKLILDQNAVIYLREWLEIRGSAPGALFCYITRGDHLRRLEHHLSPRALHLILKNRIAGANRAAEAIKPLTWHDFRRTVISDIISDSKQGGLVEAQKIAGHSSVITTAKYDRLWREKIYAALKSRPDVPYHVRNTAKGKAAQVTPGGK